LNGSAISAVVAGRLVKPKHHHSLG
jgi:hypothetical protein